MINLIRNELYKIFHKKGIYIVIFITLLYVLLTNYLYSTDIYDASFDVELENSYYDESDDIVYDKALEMYDDYVDTYSDDSWQYAMFYYDEDIKEELINNYVEIISYEMGLSSDSFSYKEAISSRDNIYEILSLTWQEFVSQRISYYEEININNEYLAKIEALNFRLDYDICYQFDDKNEDLSNYIYSRIIQLEYENQGIDNLSSSDLEGYKNLTAEVETIKYRLTNDIDYYSYDSIFYVLENFYDEYFIMILVMIILVSGSIVSDEFSKGTIKNLLVKPYSRTKILISKFITTIIMILFAIVITFILELAIGGIFFGFSSLDIPVIIYNYTDSVIESVPIIKYFLIESLAVLPEFILIGTIAFTLSTLFTSTSLANTLTIIGVFGSTIIESIAMSFELNILKGYLTLNWDFSCYLFGGSSPYLGVTLPFSVVVCLVYLVVMLAISIIVFKKRNIKNI